MDTDKSRPDQGATNNEACGWKSAKNREAKVKQIMDSLLMATPQSWISNSSDIKKIAEKIEEQSYSSVTEENDYLAKISRKLSQTTESPVSVGFNHLHSNSSCSSEPSSAPGGRAADTELQEEVCQRVAWMKDTYMKRLTTVYQLMIDKTQQGLNTTDMNICKNEMILLEDIFKHLNVTKSEITADFMERLDNVENNIDCILRFVRASHSTNGMLQHDMSHSRISQLELSGQEKSVKLMQQVPKETCTTQGQGNTQPLIKGDTSPHSSENLSPSSFEIADQQQTSGALVSDSSAAMQRLLKVLTNISPEALRASVSEIQAVVHLTDRMSASEPLNGSKDVIGIDLVEDIGAHSPARYTTYAKKPVKRRCLDTKRPVMNSDPSQEQQTRHEAKFIVLEEEIREINNLLLDTEVVISGEGRIQRDAELVKGLIVQCLFRAVTVDMDLKSLQASDEVSIIQPLQLLVPSSYPWCSPIFLDEIPSEVCTDLEDFSTRAKWKLGLLLRTMKQPFSIEDIAVSWENCAREAIIDYAQQQGGGTFSSKYGKWEKYSNDC